MLKDAKFCYKFYRDKELRVVSSFPAASMIHKKSPPVTLSKASFGVKTLVFESSLPLHDCCPRHLLLGKASFATVWDTTQPEESAPVVCC